MDKGRVENELFVILHCRRNDVLQEITTSARYFCVLEPTRSDACNALVQHLRIWALTTYSKEKMFFTCMSTLFLLAVALMGHLLTYLDGASVNISAQNGMQGKLKAALPWLHWGWCYAHRLELACKDLFTSNLFRDIDDMLQRLYYLYEKFPKKCRKLSDIIDDLKEVYKLPQGGNLPVRACGSQLITYKRKALQRVNCGLLWSLPEPYCNTCRRQINQERG